MKIVNTHEAKTHLSRRELGFAADGVRIGEDFDAPLPPAVLQTFYGGGAS